MKPTWKIDVLIWTKSNFVILDPDGLLHLSPQEAENEIVHAKSISLIVLVTVTCHLNRSPAK